MLAFMLDVALVWGAGYLLWMRYREQFVRMGAWGVLVGIGMVMGYCGVLNSRIGRGQTPGKRLLGLHLVGKEGMLISLRRSLLRAGALAVPFFLGSASLWGLPMIPFGLLILTLSLTLKGGIAYFYLVNSQTCQGLHDLIARTCVVREDPNAPGQGFVFPSLSRAYYVGWGAIAVICAGFYWAVGLELLPESLSGQYLAPMRIRQLDGVHDVRLDTRGFSEKDNLGQVFAIHVLLRRSLPCDCASRTGRLDCRCASGLDSRRVAGVLLKAPEQHPGGGRGYRYEVRPDPQTAPPCACSHEPEGPCASGDAPGCPCAVGALAAQVAGIVLDTYPFIGEQETLTVHIRRGFGIGLWKGVSRQSFSQSLLPEAWRRKLGKEGATNALQEDSPH
jgi:uncharacterized RDD family membrane protein YckC